MPECSLLDLPQGDIRLLEALVANMDPTQFAAHCDFALIQAASGGEASSVAWLLDRGAKLHVNEDQPLFEVNLQVARKGN